jgi:hypothetical protein
VSSSPLSSWDYAVSQAILSLQAKGLPYQWASSEENHSGTSRDLVAEKTKVATAAKPPKSYCCGATFEVFWDAVCSYAQKNPFSAATWKKAYAGFFRFDTPDTSRGVADGLSLIADDLSALGLLVREGSDPLTAPPFSFVQIQFSDDPQGPGHSAILLGPSTLDDGRPCVVVWSSQKSYQAAIAASDEGLVVQKEDGLEVSGYGLDYFVITPRSGSRTFFCAWLEEA